MGNGRDSPLPFSALSSSSSSPLSPSLSHTHSHSPSPSIASMFSSLKPRRLLLVLVCLLFFLMHLLYVHFEVSRNLSSAQSSYSGGNKKRPLESGSDPLMRQLEWMKKEDEKKKKEESDTPDLLQQLVNGETSVFSIFTTTTTLDINNLAEHDHVHEDATESPEALAAKIECRQMLEQYKVVVGIGWGDMIHYPEKQKRWESLYCNKYASDSARAEWYKNHTNAWTAITLPPNYPIQPVNPNPEIPIIAICVCVTTRSLKIYDFRQLSFFQKLIPSFLKYAERNHTYWIYLAYDEGDHFLDQPDHLKQIDEHFANTVQKPLAFEGIQAKLFHHKFYNEAKRPGPVFNYITNIAVADGADYIYRINDDTEFASPWAVPFISHLKGWGAPYGVVGPTCHEGNTNILTHDFTHRLHHEIFPSHYPPSLSDWWMDDWVSRVYGRARTWKLSNVRVIHHTGSHGTRYDVDHTHGALLEGEIEEGRKQMEKWLTDHGMHDEYRKYKAGEFRFHVKVN